MTASSADSTELAATSAERAETPGPEEPPGSEDHGQSAAATTPRDTHPPLPSDSMPSDQLLSDPAWTRPALGLLLVGTAVAYLWNLGVNGWANTYYAAAVQAGTMNWKAFFFGSSDPANFITVDKPPISLWIMELSGRIFGFNSWSMLAPEALLGVASVGLLYLAVRRPWGAQAGLLAGLALAVTPVAVLMFRFNNPDAALTFFMVAAAYTMTRALEHAGIRWLLATGALIGVAFLTKELQALLVVPGLALAYLVCAPVGVGKRVGQLLLTGLAMVVTGLWWPVVVDLLPASSRPYVGGSTDNSVLELALGYNGLGRITGAESAGTGGAGPPGGGQGGGPGGMFSGDPGLGRLFNTEFGGFIGWLIPAAIVGLIAAGWLTRRAGRTDPRRASLLLWTGWFVVTAVVFSFSKGIIHTYYGIALAPAVAALAAMALPTLWRSRATLIARLLLASASVGTALAGYLLLNRAPTWLPWLRWTVLVAGLLVAVALLVGAVLRARVGARLGARSGGVWLGRARPGTILVAVAVVSAVAAPGAWSAATIGSAHGGGVPGVGPARSQAGQAGRGGFGGRGGVARPGRQQMPSVEPQMPEGMTQDEWSEMLDGQPGAGGPGAPGGQGFSGGSGGGSFGEQTVDPALAALLRSGAAGYTWAAAAQSSGLAAPLQLSSDQAVMALGGFGGNDPAITLDVFRTYVSEHKVHYYVAAGSGGFGRGGFGGGPGGDQSDGAVAIGTWISATFTATTVGGSQVYDLSAPQ